VAYFFGPLCISKAQEHCAQICSSAQNVRGMLKINSGMCILSFHNIWSRYLTHKTSAWLLNLQCYHSEEQVLLPIHLKQIRRKVIHFLNTIIIILILYNTICGQTDLHQCQPLTEASEASFQWRFWLLGKAAGLAVLSMPPIL